jgi:hypothetical protein
VLHYTHKVEREQNYNYAQYRTSRTGGNVAAFVRSHRSFAAELVRYDSRMHGTINNRGVVFNVLSTTSENAVPTCSRSWKRHVAGTNLGNRRPVCGLLRSSTSSRYRTLMLMLHADANMRMCMCMCAVLFLFCSAINSKTYNPHLHQ